MITPWDRASFIMFFVWELCPSKSNKIFRSSVVPLNSMNFLNHFGNNSAVIQPESLQTPQAPGAAFGISCVSIFFLGNIIMGGMYWPLALKHFSIVTVAPLSAEVMAPSCF